MYSNLARYYERMYKGRKATNNDLRKQPKTKNRNYARASQPSHLPSAAPTTLGQDAKPNLRPACDPAPASASSVVSVPAKGLEIYLTTAAFLPCLANQPNTWQSFISFQITPCPPGFMIGWRGSGTGHYPSSADTTGTRG